MSLEKGFSLTSQSALLAFFYCDFRKPESLDPLNILGSLVAQLCSQTGYTCVELDLAFEHSRHSNKRPSVTLLRDVLCSLSVSRKVVLLIDAVDECVQRQELLSSMTYLQSMGENISVFLTSRNELDIQDALLSFKVVQLESWKSQVDSDIKAYINHRLLNDQRLGRLKRSVREEIRERLHERSSGMYVPFSQPLSMRDDNDVAGSGWFSAVWMQFPFSGLSVIFEPRYITCQRNLGSAMRISW